MATKGNPAQRLYDIILGVNGAWNDVKSTGNSNPTSWQVWAKFFDIDISGIDQRIGQFELIHRLNECAKLTDEIQALLVANNRIDHAKYLRSFPKYKALFSTPAQLTDTFVYAGIITDDLTRLEFCLDAIDETYHEKIVDEDKLNELLSEVQSLYSAILDEDIALELKRILLDMLHTMERAIQWKEPSMNIEFGEFIASMKHSNILSDFTSLIKILSKVLNKKKLAVPRNCFLNLREYIHLRPTLCSSWRQEASMCHFF